MNAVLLFISTNHGGNLANLLSDMGTVVCPPGSYHYDAKAKRLIGPLTFSANRELFHVPDGTELIIASPEDTRKWLVRPTGIRCHSLVEVRISPQVVSM